MASKHRALSESGYYHVMQRGVNRFDLFEDDDDRAFYLRRLCKYAAEAGVTIVAWCLMSDHTHLIVRSDQPNLSDFMRQLGSVYARYFNRRHCRSGPLFEGRFCSVCVESDAQIVAAVRYVHRNPVHHEQAALCGTYPWSSYGEYAANAPETCKTEFVLSLFGSVEELVAFHEGERDHEWHLDLDSIGPLTDGQARILADEALAKAGFDIHVSDIGKLVREKRDAAISQVKRAVGCSLRQIQRLTAIAYSAIRRAVSSPPGEGVEGLERAGWLPGEPLTTVKPATPPQSTRATESVRISGPRCADLSRASPL